MTEEQWESEFHYEQEQIEEQITAEEAYYEYLRDEEVKNKELVSWKDDGVTYITIRKNDV